MLITNDSFSHLAMFTVTFCKARKVVDVTSDHVKIWADRLYRHNSGQSNGDQQWRSLEIDTH
jgi:hypothetical protein